jgi:hypothetical protein
MLRTSLLAVVAALVILTAAAVAPAFGSSSLDVGVADDRILLAEGGASAQRAVQQWREAGVDVVRIHARWDRVERSEGQFDWARLDEAIGLVRGAGLRVMLAVTGPGPVDASEVPVRGDGRYKPSPERFAAYARAVAGRYGAEVDDYIAWNEPNHEDWLRPQNTCVRSRCRPFAPHHYRRLVQAADPAIRAADPGARIHLGALAPLGTSGTSANARLTPLRFLRELGCVSSSYRRVRTGDCRGFRSVRADGLAYHPHNRTLSPATRSRVPDWAAIADLGRLTSVVDRAGLRTHGGGRLPLHLTEFGYQTNPPDRTLGVSASRQSLWLQQSAYIAYRHPRVRTLVNYVWRDEPGATTGWQSGMFRTDDSAKPSFASFPDPFWADGRRLWGQVRPGDGAQRVEIQRRSGTWRTVASVTTSSRGYFTRTVSRAGTYRFVWSGGTSDARTVR